MFDKKSFSEILTRIYKTYNSQRDFADSTGVNRAYLSQYMNQKLENPPTPKILERIANNSNGIISYAELMEVCGHFEGSVESVVYEIYQNLKRLCREVSNSKDNELYEVETAIGQFQEYSSTLLETIEEKDLSQIYLTDFYREAFFLEDSDYLVVFLCLYEAFLKCLEKEGYIALFDYKFSNWFDKEQLYERIIHLNALELFSNNNTKIKIAPEYQNNLCDYIRHFTTALNLAYLSDYDSNTLIDLFKEKVNKGKSNIISSDSTFPSSPSASVVFVYGTIPAGIPMEAIEDIIDTEEIPVDMLKGGKQYFALKIKGDSMSPTFLDSDVVIFEKADTCESGQDCAVMVNGNDATFKRVLKNENGIILQPLNPAYEPLMFSNEQILNLPVRIIGIAKESRRKF